MRGCREPGWSEIPTIPLYGLSDAKRRALMIAETRLAENAEWNERLLAEHLKDLTLADLDFSIEVIGFEMGEIDIKISGLERDEPAAEDPAARFHGSQGSSAGRARWCGG